MISIVFDSPPGSESQFVEVERDGKSVKFGEWKQHGDYWHLELFEIDQLEARLKSKAQTITHLRNDAWKFALDRDKLKTEVDILRGQIAAGIGAAAYEKMAERLGEAERTIRMAYSELPHDNQNATETLGSYINIHKLEEW